MLYDRLTVRPAPEDHNGTPKAPRKNQRPEWAHLVSEWVHPDHWVQWPDDEWCVEGEHVDGEPSWTVEKLMFGYRIKFEIGWYTQCCDAEYPSELPDRFRRMVAANKAFEKVGNDDG